MLKKYPHLTYLVLSFVLAFALFFILGSEFFESLVAPLGTFGIFFAGMMYAYSVTASTGAILLPSFLGQYSIATIAIIGGLGGMVADVLILRFIKGTLHHELILLSKETFFKVIKKLPLVRREWFRDIVGIIAIMSPLPNTIGVAIMASTHITEDSFHLISLAANIVGIYLLVSAISIIT